MIVRLFPYFLTGMKLQVYHEDRLAEIDIPIGSLIGDLIALSLDCFVRTLAGEEDQSQMFDSSSQVLCKVVDAISSSHLGNGLNDNRNFCGFENNPFKFSLNSFD
jgi:hypothetical protein